MLLRSGSDRMLENNAGETPYMVAHKYQQFEAERLLLNIEQQHGEWVIWVHVGIVIISLPCPFSFPFSLSLLPPSLSLPLSFSLSPPSLSLSLLLSADKAIQEMNTKPKKIIAAYSKALKNAHKPESRIRLVFVGDLGSGNKNNT